jgi:hypothetical protein
MDIMHRKAGAGDVIGKGRWSGGHPFEKSAHLLVESPVKKAFLSTIQADLSCTPQISFADSSNSQSVETHCNASDIKNVIPICKIDLSQRRMAIRRIAAARPLRTSRRGHIPPYGVAMQYAGGYRGFMKFLQSRADILTKPRNRLLRLQCHFHSGIRYSLQARHTAWHRRPFHFPDRRDPDRSSTEGPD